MAPGDHGAMNTREQITSLSDGCHTSTSSSQGLSRVAKGLRASLVAALTVACGAFDYATGTEVSVFLVYLLPIALATRTMGVRAGVWTALLACACWVMADQASGHAYTQPWILWVNALHRLATFLMAAMAVHLVATVRHPGRWWRWAQTDWRLSHCSQCNQVRGPDGTWMTALQHLETLHGEPALDKACPACARRHYVWSRYSGTH